MSNFNFKYPDKYSFAGNPICFKIEADSDLDQQLLIEVYGESVIVLERRPYKKGDLFYSEFEISDILLTYFEDITITEGQVLTPIDKFIIKYKLIFFQDNISITTFEGIAINGGINSKNIQMLSSLQLTMFDYRLNNYKNQFLFTTRTNSKQFILKQSELFPFLFIHPGKLITFVTSGGKMIIPEMYSVGIIAALDINALRKMFFELYHILPSYFAVMVDNEFSFDISLLPSQISEEKYFLLFKNSLGGYEKVEVTGKGNDTVEFQDEDVWKSINEADVMEDHRSRLISKSGISVEAGYKNKEELSFLLDLIKSDEVYFIDPAEPVGVLPERCLITTDKFNVPRRITSPQSIALKLAFVHEDQFESPRIVFESGQSVFQNITRPGAPEWDGDGFIYGDDYMLYGE